MRFMVLMSLAVLAACSSMPECDELQPYQTARPIPPLRAPGGLAVPQVNSAYQIPGESGYLAKAGSGPNVACRLPWPPRVVPNPSEESGEAEDENEKADS